MLSSSVHTSPIYGIWKYLPSSSFDGGANGGGDGGIHEKKWMTMPHHDSMIHLFKKFYGMWSRLPDARRINDKYQ
jgi:hypothetical protein